MDIPRPSQAKAKLRKRLIIGAVVVAILGGLTFAISSLKPAAPTVDRSLVWIDTVKRGPLVRQVRGVGTLVPEDIRFLTARTAGHVERIVLRPGAAVKPDSVILVLANPDVAQAADTAESQLHAAESEYTNLKISLESQLLSMEASLASAKSDDETSRLQAEVYSALFKEGLISELELQKAKVTAEDAATRHQIEKKRYAFTQESMKLQLQIKTAEVERARSLAKLRREDMDALTVRAGMTGVLQTLSLEVGQQFSAGSVLAKVADPTRLKAEIRVAETQAKDIRLGQPAEIDTRNGLVPGRVSRVDPSVQNGTVTVDVALKGPLPDGARPDLSVDGTIELQRLNDVVYVGRPAFGQENSTIGIFKLDPDGNYATRVQVKLGRSSVNTIEVLSGLQPGDRVILSDMSQWDSTGRVRLN
ncbi:macrolide transporter subunit MacA [mine drainage metagenome]|uniref:Macrolide transporter subunit MacA n=1 Tax=mine drainage metagenome TaxID=410659 RepID=A0A1J5S6J4_9ZZZZ